MFSLNNISTLGVLQSVEEGSGMQPLSVSLMCLSQCGNSHPMSQSKSIRAQALSGAPPKEEPPSHEWKLER